MKKVKRVLIDTDVGTDADDALALALAIKSPEIDLCAVTTASGDSLMRARIARKILALGGSPDIPVSAGLDFPLLRKRKGWWLGHEGKGVLETERDGLPIDPRHSTDLLVQTILQSEEPSTLVTIGPVSNVAFAIIREPLIIQRIEQLVIMGGCIYPQRVGDGQLPDRVAARMEHNLGADPDASEVVFDSGIPIILVPIEVSTQVWLTDEDRLRLREVNTPLANTLTALVDIWVEAFGDLLVTRGLPRDFARAYLHDPLAVAVAFDQNFVELKSMSVVLERQESVLRTLVKPDRQPTMEVCVDVDVTAFRQFVLDRVTG